MIKVLHIITGLSTGGAQTMLLKLLSATNRKKFSSIVVSLANKGAIGPLIEELEVPVYALEMWRGVPSPAALLRLASIVRRVQPHIIQGWMYHGNFAAQICTFFLKENVPLLWNIRGSHTVLSAEKALTAFLIWLGGKFSSIPAAIVNNSQVSALAHQEKFGYLPAKWVIIPNGFDVDLFRPDLGSKGKLCSELGVRFDSTLVGLVGRYHPMKGHDVFLTAASLLVEKCKNIHFILVGPGVDEHNRELTNRIDALNLQKSVHLLGRRTDMAQLSAAFDVACSSSYGEGFSNAIGEAMSCGVPCVVTDVGDSGWIIGETGRLVPPGQPVALANACGELIAMGEKGRHALGTMARQRITEYFSLGSAVSQYEDLYEKVLKLNEENC